MDDWIVQMEQQAQQQRTAVAAAAADSPDPNGSTSYRKPFYRVPENARQGRNRSLYLPQKISIGPYHNGTPSYQQGERDKEQCLVNFLSRSDTTLQALIDSLVRMVDEVRDMYDGLDDRWVGEDKKEAFARMMVVDGCYLLEIMMEAMESQGYSPPLPHPVFNHNEMETYKHDMLLLDNQIPLKVLDCIVETSDNNSSAMFLVDMLVAFNDSKPKFSQGKMSTKRFIEVIESVIMTWTVNWKSLSNNERKSPRFLSLLIHDFFSLSGDGKLGRQSNASSSSLLGLYRRGLLGGKKYTNLPIGLSFLVSSFYDWLPSATQLEEAQIVINPSLHCYQIDVSFNKRTGLVLPRIAIDKATKSNFHNMILYETHHPSENYHFASYIYFMHCLLKDDADSRLLRVRGILNTTLPDVIVIRLFNELGKSISFSSMKPMDKRIWEVGVYLSKQSNKNMQRWRKDLFQKYLNSPWAYVSIFVAFLIFAFTALQTIYTILGYYGGN